MNLFSGILPDQLIKAIGWTLIHSLWQGVVIALLFILLYYTFRNHRAQFRYMISVAALMVLFLATSVTFYVTYRGQDPGSSALTSNVIGESIIPGFNLSAGAENLQADNVSRLHGLIQHIPDRFYVIVNLWMIGLIIISLRLAGTTFMAYRYKKTNLTHIPEQLGKKFSQLVERLNVSGRVKLCASKLVRNPMVIGYLKPVVLLPASAISHVPCEQLEAILVHELAHIKRHDFLVNILQNLAEVVMFYHPVIWYLNHQIRKERENCCDDMAVEYGGSLTYAKALSTVHEIQYYPKLILALGVRKNHLLNRVVRILNPKKMKTNLFDKLITGVVFAAAMAVILVSTGATYSQGNEKDPTRNVVGYVNSIAPVPVTDPDQSAVSPYQRMIGQVTVSEPLVEEEPVIAENEAFDAERNDKDSLNIKDNVITRTIDDNGKVTEYKLVVKGGEVTEFYVDGEKIPEEDHGKYQAVIDETLEEVVHMKNSLADARIDLEKIDWEEMKLDIQESLKEVMEIDMEEIKAELREIEMPEIDFEEIRVEIEVSLQEAMESLEEIDLEEIMEDIRESFEEIDFDNDEEREEMEYEMQEEMEEAMIQLEEEKARLEKEMEQMTQEAYQEYQAEMAEAEFEIQRAIEEMETINHDEIRAEMEEAMKELEESQLDMEMEIKKIDDMIKEIEKLELEEDIE